MNLCEWLTIEPSEERERLLETLFECHREAATNNENLSSVAIMQVASAGRGIESAIAGGLMTLGDIHGPVSQARVMIFTADDEQLWASLEAGRILPGWGNAFFKGEMDPAIKPMAELISQEYPKIDNRLMRITEIIAEVKGKRIFANAAAYTAVTADLLELPLGVEMVLAIAARLPTWTSQYLEAQP
jgi:citrate synthase